MSHNRSSLVWCHALDVDHVLARVAARHTDEDTEARRTDGQLACVRVHADLVLDPELEPVHGPLIVVAEDDSECPAALFAAAFWPATHIRADTNGEVCVVSPDYGEIPDPYTLVQRGAIDPGRRSITIDRSTFSYLAAQAALEQLAKKETT
jgi:hypothetical protein